MTGVPASGPLSGSRLIGFAATIDPQRSRAFYEGVLGLRLVADEPFALVFDADGSSLRIQKVARFDPQPHTVLGWSLRDIAATVRALVARGVTFERFAGLDQDGTGIWRSPSGARVAWLKDPDGNVLSLTQLAND